MDVRRFEETLRADGFSELETKSVAAGTHNGEHSHPFEVRALVLEGRIALTVDGATRSYSPGEGYLVGRRRWPSTSDV